MQTHYQYKCAHLRTGESIAYLGSIWRKIFSFSCLLTAESKLELCNLWHEMTTSKLSNCCYLSHSSSCLCLSRVSSHFMAQGCHWAMKTSTADLDCSKTETRRKKKTLSLLLLGGDITTTVRTIRHVYKHHKNVNIWMCNYTVNIQSDMW